MKDKKRTAKQSKALHKFFSDLAITLNEQGFYIGQVIRFDAPWDGDRVKELIWREVQKKATGKNSTTQITTKEINDILDTIYQAFANKGIEVDPFPSIETLMYRSLEETEY